jgi:hypothetical protein
MKLRRLNDLGLHRMGEFLDSLTSDTPQEYPAALLTDPAASEDLPVDVEIEQHDFVSRFEAARYLDGCLTNVGIPDLDRDKGLWAWLSLFYFDQLYPKNKRGKKKPGERARWIPVFDDYTKYYRHLLAGPYRIFKFHEDNPERALVVLCGPVHVHGELAEQLGAYQEIVTNKAVMEAATSLYVDPVSKTARRGVGGKGAGSPRRLAAVLGQFDVTWDLYAMTCSALLDVLPAEFNRFKMQQLPLKV